MEDLRFAGVFVGKSPIPVGLGTGVRAFVAEKLIVEVGIVAVPVEEDALDVLVSMSLARESNEERNNEIFDKEEVCTEKWIYSA